MLLEGAERFLHQAVAAMGRRDYTERGRLVNRACAIVRHLVTMINPEADHAVVKNLHGIYAWWIKETLQGSWKHQPERLERVAQQMTSLRATWEQVRPAQSEQPMASDFSLEGLVG
jgi:flagellar biosynthetic protein FliS